MTRAVFLFLLPAVVRAVNNWAAPCLEGSCSYDVDGPFSGSLYISGSPNSVSDLTEAAGWTILDCDTQKTAQDIRAVCNESTTGGCDHLFQGGAVGTIVRLPENCTQMPFARVAKIWDHEDQPYSLTSRGLALARESSPTVKGITLDTNFGAVDPSINGNVNMFFSGTSAPRNGDDSPGTAAKRNSVSTRSPSDHVGATLQRRDIYNDTHVDSSPIVVDTQTTLLNETLGCQIGKDVTGTCGLSIGIDLQANISIYFGALVNATIVPPDVADIQLYAGLNGTLIADLLVNVSTALTVDTGSVTLVQVGFPGLSIPEILTIGPIFQINAEAHAELDVEVDTIMGLNLTIINGELAVPPIDNQSAIWEVVTGPSNPQLSAGSSATSNSTVTASIIPSLAFGINAFDGDAEATIFMDMDIFTTLDLSAVEHSSASSNDKSTAKSAGCANLHAGYDFSGGGIGQFFNIFNDSDVYQLYAKDFELFQKCFEGCIQNNDAAGCPKDSTTGGSGGSGSSSNGAQSLVEMTSWMVWQSTILVALILTWLSM